jgi:hypothetical protein
MLVGDRVSDLFAAAASHQHSSGLEDPEVLRDERLGGVKRGHEFVHTPFAIAQLEQDGQAKGIAERLQQARGRLQL